MDPGYYTLIRWVGVGIPAILALACGVGENGPPDLVGRVAVIEEAGERLLLHDVEAPFLVSNDTVVVRSEGSLIRVQGAGGAWATGATDDIQVGARLRVWTNNVELRSTPPQYTARRIDVLGLRGP